MEVCAFRVFLLIYIGYCRPTAIVLSGFQWRGSVWNFYVLSSRRSCCSVVHNHMEPSATRTTVTGPVEERLQAGTEDAPVIDRPAPLRRLHDSDVAYKYPDILTYLRHERRYQFISKCDCAQVFSTVVNLVRRSESVVNNHWQFSWQLWYNVSRTRGGQLLYAVTIF